MKRIHLGRTQTISIDFQDLVDEAIVALDVAKDDVLSMRLDRGFIVQLGCGETVLVGGPTTVRAVLPPATPGNANERCAVARPEGIRTIVVSSTPGVKVNGTSFEVLPGAPGIYTYVSTGAEWLREATAPIANSITPGFAPAVGGTANRVCLTTDGANWTPGLIVNADIDAAAAIAWSKIASSGMFTSGTWTPNWVGRTTPGTQTYSTNTGKYIRWGNLVFVRAEIVLTANSGGAGDAVITMPLTIASGELQALTMSYIGNVTMTSGYDFFTIGLDSGSTRCLTFENRSANTRNNVSITQVGATGRIAFSGVYETS